MEHNLFVLVDLLGTFAFAVSGALAAEQRRLDLFGVLAISYLTACGGGVIRDLCLGALPPVGISDWRYLATSALAAGLAIWARPIIDHLKHPIVFFDSLGLGFFAVIGAHKALQFGHNVEVAILLGMVTAVGGGVVRDVVLNRVPIILEKEIYAIAALVGAAIQVLGQLMEWKFALTPWFGALTCFGLRALAVRYSWSLPVVRGRDVAQ
ncbi:trimeric intracellular cation channel family protein [Cupriavidus sp. WKF15]|uniref:trimeric intracellular cation channel family protein n=1 Tax=Cupriavidus sp. WKF15 TaxID=3032282 RepID=UPI0023E278E3|nr:trimeric intracellular cation channel family protein [Cupriavidus sp. WKF15]WER49912.1 trimeric intracellular cation channel family protein [Cupriavidus sp. WKF15]